MAEDFDLEELVHLEQTSATPPYPVTHSLRNHLTDSTTPGTQTDSLMGASMA